MWTVDVSLAAPLTLLVCVMPAVVLPVLARRAGWADPGVRRILWTGVAVAAVPLLAQTWLVSRVEAGGPPRPGASGVPGTDQAVLHWFVEHRTAWATGLAIVLAAIGGPAAMTVLVVAAAAVLGWLGRWPHALLVAGTGAGAGLLVDGFKAVLARHRPPRADMVIHYTGHSLPSGHAVGSLVVIGVVTAVLLRPPPGAVTDPVTGVVSRAAPAAIVFGAAVLVLGIGWCRLYLGAHWLTDVLVGWLLGGAWLVCAVTALALLDRAAPAGPVAVDLEDRAAPGSPLAR